MVSAPISGVLTNLENVNDQVFSSKMMGDGFAVKPNPGSNKVVAPVSGKIVSLPSTKHAVGITMDNGIDVLVHVGIDTVELKGQGFKSFVKEGQMINRGDKMLSFDENFMEEQGVDMTVMTIFTDGYEKMGKLTKNYGGQVTPEDLLLSE